MTTSSRMLINESPLLVLPSLVMRIGLIEGVILQQIHFWLDINSKKKDASKIEDRYWTYNTYRDWQEQMPWWSEATIKKAILNMEHWGILVSKQLKAKMCDHTKYYSIDYERLEKLKSCELPIEEFMIKYPIDEILNIPSDEILDIPSNEYGMSDLNQSETTTESTAENTILAPAAPAENSIIYPLPPETLHVPSASEIMRERTILALQSKSPQMMDHTGLNVLDLSKFPNDVQEVIGKVCQLWKLRPPTGKDRAQWIQSARELLDACGEFGPELLDTMRVSYVDEMRKNGGLPRFPVSGPGSLTKTARSMAALQRDSASPSPAEPVEIISEDSFYDTANRR